MNIGGDKSSKYQRRVTVGDQSLAQKVFRQPEVQGSLYKRR